MPKTLEIRKLHVEIEGREIIKGVDLTVSTGEIHAIMGPNGSGKSTLSYSILGHPDYAVTQGEVLFDGENVLDMKPDERAAKGLFLAFQYPVEVPGVTLASFLRTAVNSIRKKQARWGGQPLKEISAIEFYKRLEEKMNLLQMDPSFAQRYLNEGFSGGEKKRAEILQMAMLGPSIAILDETDSGLDIDALRIVSDGVNALYGPDVGLLVITHYQRILRYVQPQFVHVLVDGRIALSGGPELAEQLEEHGYDWVKDQLGESAVTRQNG
ncbi:MAG: Fe-S cluster assembly ATPase SufC [Ignavibacteriales bacterium CG07_land_8_20_14_0_80_59_12]|nr:MAG: Fe-S cluster assembly ATPase SufC [Ignavibacteriales bacterium CG07_land_8_20_14_0_80_59_12]